MLSLDFNRKPSVSITVIHKPKSKTFTFVPQYLEKVIFFHEETQRYRTGLYVDIWQNLCINKSDSNETSPFLHECMPYCGKPENQVRRAYVIDIEEGFSTYADLELIGEFNKLGIDWAHSQNLDAQAREATERLEAFGKVEAA